MSEDRIIGHSRIIKDEAKNKQLLKLMNAKTRVVSIRLTETEFSMLEEVCSREDIKPSIFAQEALMLGVTDSLNQQGIKRDQFIKPM